MREERIEDDDGYYRLYEGWILMNGEWGSVVEFLYRSFSTNLIYRWRVEAGSDTYRGGMKGEK